MKKQILPRHFELLLQKNLKFNFKLINTPVIYKVKQMRKSETNSKKIAYIFFSNCFLENKFLSVSVSFLRISSECFNVANILVGAAKDHH